MIDIHVLSLSKLDFKTKRHLTCLLSSLLDNFGSGRMGVGGTSIEDKKGHTILFRAKPYLNIKYLIHALVVRISSYR